MPRPNSLPPVLHRRVGRLLSLPALVAALLVASAAGCSTEPPVAAPRGSADGSLIAASGTNATTVPAPPPAPFTGSVEDFYRVPDPLPPGAPGELLRVQDVAADAAHVTVRVMYHSRDAQDRDRAVTGIVTYPTAAPPADGWPVTAWAHGTTGLTAICAPSRGGGAAPDLGLAGVRTATDYIGLGPVGERHAYLSGPSEAHSVIDSVRAARQLTAGRAGTRWVAAGHSQGGHAALFTHQLAEAYAPELDLLGTAVIAPASVLERTFGPADQIVPRMVGIMALYGIATDHPQIDPDDYVGEAVKAKAGVIDQQCLNGIVNELVYIPPDVFYARSPLETEPARSVVRANDPGHVAVDAPLLVVYGTADTWVVPDRVHALFDQLCGSHQVTQVARTDGATHGSVVGQAAPVIASWFRDRLAGAAPRDDCGTPFP